MLNISRPTHFINNGRKANWKLFTSLRLSSTWAKSHLAAVVL